MEPTSLVHYLHTYTVHVLVNESLKLLLHTVAKW
jgi:hypothetical protein